MSIRRTLVSILVSLTACSTEGGASDTEGTDTTTTTPTGSAGTTEQTTSPTDATSNATSDATSDLTTDGPDVTTATSTTGTTDPGSTGAPPLEKFSFFVTSLRAMQELSGSQDGFGGDLSFGEQGPGAGLRGADKICAAIADESMPGASAKGWRAFLSVTADENGQPVNAIDRVDNGRHWISDHEAGGCAPGVNIEGGGPPQPGDDSVGAGGGYGGIYCFALTP